MVHDPEGVRKNLGFYSATTALYPRLTTRETIEFFARINQYPSDRVRERVDYLIQRFSLQKYADARIEKLSSGMKQKVSIARTVAHDPKLALQSKSGEPIPSNERALFQKMRNQTLASLNNAHLASIAE